MDEETIARFKNKVDRRGPVPTHRPSLGRCHIWLGSKNSRGYGKFWISGKHERAHRVAFFIKYGRWPTPQALHRCDNRSCVRLSHLFEGTQADNNQDMRQKGRARWGCRRGEAHGRAKFSDEQVAAARAALGKIPRRELMQRFGMSKSTISDLSRGKTRSVRT